MKAPSLLGISPANRHSCPWNDTGNHQGVDLVYARRQLSLKQGIGMRSNWDLRGRRWAASAIIVVGSILAPPAVWAEDAEDTVEKVSEQSEAASKLLGEKQFFVMPIPIANPTIGTGLGVSAMHLFQAGENAPPSSVSLMGFYTDSDSWAAAVGTKTYFKDDKYRLSGWAGYYDVNLEFFGIGSGAGDRGQSIGINQNGPFLMSRFLFQVAENLYLGPQYRFVSTTTSLQNPILPPGLPGDIIPRELRSVTSGLGVAFEYDSRDSKFFPLQGSHMEGTANFARDVIGSDRNYNQYEVAYNLYRELGESAVLAWRATGCFRDGQTPFYDLCMFGGESDAIRGYVGGQYRDDISLTTQLEFRWKFYKKWGMVAFAGIGEVAPSVADMDLDHLLPSAGVGLRFMVSEKEKVNLSIDFAKGEDSSAWYFRIGEAF